MSDAGSIPLGDRARALHLASVAVVEGPGALAEWLVTVPGGASAMVAALKASGHLAEVPNWAMDGATGEVIEWPYHDGMAMVPLWEIKAPRS